MFSQALYRHRNVIHVPKGIFSIFINTLLPRARIFRALSYTAHFLGLVKNFFDCLFDHFAQLPGTTPREIERSVTPAILFARHINVNRLPLPPPLHAFLPVQHSCTLHTDVTHSISWATPYMCCERKLYHDYFWGGVEQRDSKVGVAIHPFSVPIVRH